MINWLTKKKSDIKDKVNTIYGDVCWIDECTFIDNRSKVFNCNGMIIKYNEEKSYVLNERVEKNFELLSEKIDEINLLDEHSVILTNTGNILDNKKHLLTQLFFCESIDVIALLLKMNRFDEINIESNETYTEIAWEY